MAKELVKDDEFDLGIEVSDMMPFLMVCMIAMLASLIPSMVTLTQALKAQSFAGLEDIRTLYATSQLQWINLVTDPPYTPWITAYFFNDGPDSAFIAINNPDEFLELKKGEAKEISMAGGERRIEQIYYKTLTGTASLRVNGKY